LRATYGTASTEGFYIKITLKENEKYALRSFMRSRARYINIFAPFELRLADRP
jgi:hypothetical protein